MPMRRTPDGRDLSDHRRVFVNPNPTPNNSPAYQTQNPNTLFQNPMYHNRGFFQNPNPSPSRFDHNPNAADGIEAAFRRLNLGAGSSSPSLQWPHPDGFCQSSPLGLMGSYSASAGLGQPRASQLVDWQFRRLDDGGASSNGLGSNHYPRANGFHQQPQLNLMRSSPLASSLVDRQLRGLDDGGAYRNMIGLDHARSNLHNDSSLYPRRSQSFAELGQASYRPIRPNTYQTNHQTGTYRPRSRSVNGHLISLSHRGQGIPRTRDCSCGHLTSHPIYSSPDQVRGTVALVARDQEGCRFLKKLLEEDRRHEHTDMIFFEVKDQVNDLMIDQFGNCLMQKLFESCSDRQMTELLLSLINSNIGPTLADICIHPHGTRAMQKMIDWFKLQEQKSMLVTALKHVTATLSKDQNGHHVIQKCLNQFPPEDTKFLVKEIADHCSEIAMDKSGCCVLQPAVDRSEGKTKDRLVDEIISNALLLSEDRYGNYVVQHTLEQKPPIATAGIVDRLRGSYVVLAMNKYGSNVVEKCLKKSKERDVAMIVGELMVNDHDFLNVLQDQYGNFVAQCALDVAQGEILSRLVGKIQNYSANLHSHLFGKKVLAKAREHRHYR